VIRQEWLDGAIKAIDRRRDLLHRLGEEGTDTFRLFGGGTEGIPGLTVDVFSRVGLFGVQIEDCPLTETDLVELGEWYIESGLVDSIYQKRLGKERFREQPSDQLLNSTPLVGITAPPRLIVREWGISYLCRPYDGFQVGLFPDQRDNRRFLALRSKGKRVLNLFSYTCAFSVACGLSGAETTSVDLSRKYLEWGRENFSLNGIHLEKHRFFSSDASEFLRRAIKKAERYDLIIVDPPSFARRPKGGPFSLERELESLFSDAMRVLSPQGELFFSSNLASWDPGELGERARALKYGVGPFEEVALPGLAEDFRIGKQTLNNIFVIKT
jgi:23S rRNA (cytosine1962-C5)-methyltransferase